MDDKEDKANTYKQDLISQSSSFSNRIYNYFYFILNDKNHTSFLVINILYILETIQLISYGVSDPHINTWKINNSTIKIISDIIGIPRISVLMKYVKFDIYIVIFFVVVFFIFAFGVFLTMQILFFNSGSKFFIYSIYIIRNLIYPLSIFFYIPITELVLLPLKCNSENKIDIIKESIQCWDNLHYLYSILGIISSIIFLIYIIFLLNFFFYPFKYNDSSIRIQSTNDTVFLFIKYIFCLRFVIIKNEYLSIAILFIFSLYAMIQEFTEYTFNNSRIEIFINIKYFLAFWTYFILLFAIFFENTKINGLIFIFSFGIPIIIICCILLIKRQNSLYTFDNAGSNNLNIYLQETRLLIKLVTSFIKESKNIKFGKEKGNQKEDILLKGIIKNHTLKCIKKECPLTLFIQSTGNYNFQKQCLFNYMIIYFNSGMKRFPFSKELILYYIQFNLYNRSNLNSVRSNISLLQNSNNTNKINFITYMLSKDIQNIKNINNNKDSSNLEKEHELLNKKYIRLKYLIENSSKLYGEFWGIFATNVTNNLKSKKIYNLGHKLNLYLNEINNLWENELKSKKIDSENESIVRLYSRFLLEILWNQKKSEEINQKLNNENLISHDVKKLKNTENIDLNNIDAELENPNYIIYSASNENGECSITQCTNSIAHLLGYMKSEIIGKRIEILMPEIFKAGHADILSKKMKQMDFRNKSNINSYREQDKKNYFLVPNNKMGYLIPINAKFTFYENTDFSSSFIIKANIEPKDAKSVYAYYILTKSDLSICNISSSAINLGLTNEILNKYIIDIDFLIRDKKLENIDFFGKIKEYEEELQEVIWIYPDLIYPKEKINKEINIEDIPNLIKSSHKKKIFVQIITMKFGDSDILGYLFRIVDSISDKKDSNIDIKPYIPNNNKEILFDLLNLNYIRTEIVTEKIRNKCLRENENIIDKDKQINKSNIDKSEKLKNISNRDDINESSEEENKNKNIELTKENILEMQTKKCEDIENFINQLTFYGADIFMEKYRPNKEKYPVGKAIDPLIKIAIGRFNKNIEKKLKSNSELMMSYSGLKVNESQNQEMKNDINHEFSSDISYTLANIFKSKSIVYIRFSSIIFFIIFLGIIIIEFIFTFLNIQTIKENIFKMRNAYKLSEDIGFIKYCITEIVLVDAFKENYIILIGYNITAEEDIEWLKNELLVYSFDFRSIYQNFTSNSASYFSERYRKFVSNATQALIYTLSNGEEMTLTIPFSVMIDRIPNTIFYISSLIDESIILNMKERNMYELMVNLLNGYFVYIKELSLIIAEDAVISSKTSCINTITFYTSFVLVIIFLVLIWNLILLFLFERQRPINLFLTIKKQIFEDLKSSSEAFSNNLLNKLVGNEGNEEETLKDYHKNIKENDINIIKFKSSNEYRKKRKHHKEQIKDFIKLLTFFIIIEIYITFKFFYERNYVENVKKFLDVFNVTYYSYVDIIINIDLSKQFIYNKTIPIFYYSNSETGIDKESPIYSMFYSVTNSFEQMIIKTSETTSFLSETYKDTFSLYLYNDFGDKIFIDTYYMPNFKLLKLLDTGLKPIVANIVEKLRFLWIKCYYNKENTINDFVWCDIDYLVLYLVRPWFDRMIEILNGESNRFLNKVKVIQISLFIVVIAILILSYFILWKSYEESLALLLEKSFELIKLIPEEIKYIIVSKLNE